jgi:1-acyl-sn-glycerol-3-phosphate acyltransferase
LIKYLDLLYHNAIINQDTMENSIKRNQLLSVRFVRLVNIAQTCAYWLSRGLLQGFPHKTTLLLQPEDLQPGGTYVIAANHQSMADPFAISAALPVSFFSRLGPFRYFTHNGLFDKVLRPILLILGCFPASPNGRYIHGLEAAKLFLSRGQTVVIFPEGRRVVSATRPRSGVEVLAHDPAVVIIPARIQWYKHKGGGRSYRLMIGRPLRHSHKLSAQQILNRIYKLPL